MSDGIRSKEIVAQGPVEAERLGGGDARALHPVDADGFFVAGFVLKANRNEISVSSICFDACAKRGSSRSIGGKLVKPGKKSASDSTTRAAQATKCERSIA